MFDPRKYAFWLIAAVIGVQLVVVLVGVFACVYVGLQGVDTSTCANGRFSDLLAAALAVGLALYGANRE